MQTLERRLNHMNLTWNTICSKYIYGWKHPNLFFCSAIIISINHHSLLQLLWWSLWSSKRNNKKKCWHAHTIKTFTIISLVVVHLFWSKINFPKFSSMKKKKRSMFDLCYNYMLSNVRRHYIHFGRQCKHDRIMCVCVGNGGGDGGGGALLVAETIYVCFGTLAKGYSSCPPAFSIHRTALCVCVCVCRELLLLRQYWPNWVFGRNMGHSPVPLTS